MIHIEGSANGIEMLAAGQSPVYPLALLPISLLLAARKRLVDIPAPTHRILYVRACLF